MLLMPLPLQRCSEFEKSEQLKIQLNAKNCDLIPSFQNIEKHSMSDINKIIEDQNRELEAKLALISGNKLSALILQNSN